MASVSHSAILSVCRDRRQPGRGHRSLPRRQRLSFRLRDAVTKTKLRILHRPWPAIGLSTPSVL